MALKKNHQTAVFVLVESEGENFKERVERFVTSLNRSGEGPGSTIKADIFSVTNAGAVYQGYKATGDVLENIDPTTILSFAHSKDYAVGLVAG